MTDKGMNSLLASIVQVRRRRERRGRSVGAGAKSDVIADLITFSRSKGVYGGLNLDGTVVSSNDDWNKAYYGRPALPPDILIKASVSNPNAQKLLGEVSRVAK